MKFFIKKAFSAQVVKHHGVGPHVDNGVCRLLSKQNPGGFAVAIHFEKTMSTAGSTDELFLVLKGYAFPSRFALELCLALRAFAFERAGMFLCHVVTKDGCQLVTKLLADYLVLFVTDHFVRLMDWGRLGVPYIVGSQR